MALWKKLDMECGKDAVYNLMAEDEEFQATNIHIGAFKVALRRFLELKKLVKTPIDVYGEYMKEILAGTDITIFPSCRLTIVIENKPKTKNEIAKQKKMKNEIIQDVKNDIPELLEKVDEIKKELQEVEAKTKTITRRYDLVLCKSKYPPNDIKDCVIIYTKPPSFKLIPKDAKAVYYFSSLQNLNMYNPIENKGVLIKDANISKSILSHF